MPTDEDVLEFSSPWCDGALKFAETVDIGEVEINIINSPDFLATKLAAFHSRGKGDYLASHDLEDLIAVLDGRESVPAEVAAADLNVRIWIEEQSRFFLTSPYSGAQ